MLRRFTQSPKVLPIFIILLLTFPLVLHTSVILLARQHPSLVVSGEYFQTPDERRAARAAAKHFDELGWTVNSKFVSASRTPERTELSITFQDANGVGIKGGALEVEAFHFARASNVVRALVIEESDGVFRAVLPGHREGPWELRLNLKHDGNDFPLHQTVLVRS